jgi:hypothetical protein
MPTDIKIICKPCLDTASEIRTLFCRVSAQKHPDGYNPLSDTKFNELLDRIAQVAFDEGMRFKYPEK